MKFTIFSLLIAAIGFVACGEDQHIAQSRKDFTDPYQLIIWDDIDSLSAQHSRAMKNVFIDSSNSESKYTDSIDWVKEYEGLLSVNFTKELSKAAYETLEQESKDSASGIYYLEKMAKDTNAYLQNLIVTKRQHKLQLLSWRTKERSFLMDRDVQVGFTPGKGYIVRITENSLWSKPKNIQIQFSVENKSTLGL